MNPQTLGAALAFGTAFCWCCSALAFESAARRAGSVPINLLRLIIAFTLLTLAAAVSRRMPLPLDATPHQIRWLLLSGFVGFFIGDVTGFRAFVLLGARLTTLITCTAPIFTLAVELLVLRNAHVGWLHILAIVITIAGVAWVVLERRASDRHPKAHAKGVLLAIAGAAGQGIGAVFTAKAFEFGQYDAFSAGQVRMSIGIAAFVVFVIATRRVKDTLAAARNPAALAMLSLGAFWGPFLGVTLFILSLNYIPPSTSQTITGLVPVLIIPFAMLIHRERVSPRAALGACIAVGGIWMLLHAPAAVTK